MTTPGTEIQPTTDYDTGLGDLTQSDLSIPRLRIKHKQGVFEDGASGVQLPEMACVILGLVRQRVLFHYDVEDDDQPMCKSFDSQTGFPNLEPKKPKLTFPWAIAKFNPADFPPSPQDGLVALPCNGCAAKDWGSHPVGDKPYCAEQFTLPIYYAPTFEELQAGSYSSALISFQKTSLPPLKRYLSPFQQRGIGAYTQYTQIGLSMRKRGQTDYCVATFKSLGPTPTEEYASFSENYQVIRQFLTEARPPAREVDEDSSVGVAGVAPATPVSPAPAAAPPPPPAQSAPVQAMQRPPLGVPPVAPQPQQTTHVVEAEVVDPDELPF